MPEIASGVSMPSNRLDIIPEKETLDREVLDIEALHVSAAL